jgi:hypothetical protein
MAPPAFYGSRLLGPLGASAAAALPFVLKLAGVVVRPSSGGDASAAAARLAPPAAREAAADGAG